LCTPVGNIQWDCISLIDAATITLINGLGRLRAIAISHSHFYTMLVEWSRAFGDVPVYLHADDSATGRLHQVLARRDIRAVGGGVADPRRRALPRWDDAALGGGSGR
jgi:hypothetical protein